MSTFLQIYITFLIVVSAMVGDQLVFKALTSDTYKAIFDNATHGIIGGLIWTMVCTTCKNRYASTTIMEIILCTVLSSLIDIDHFIAARSFKLKDAISLINRPFFHCSTFPFILSIVLFLCSIYAKTTYLHRIWLLIFCAFISHHTRDATRHGYWFYPFGSTPAVPYFLYITILCVIPYFVQIALNFAGRCHYSATYKLIEL